MQPNCVKMIQVCLPLCVCVCECVCVRVVRLTWWEWPLQTEQICPAARLWVHHRRSHQVQRSTVTPGLCRLEAPAGQWRLCKLGGEPPDRPPGCPRLLLPQQALSKTGDIKDNDVWSKRNNIHLSASFLNFKESMCPFHWSTQQKMLHMLEKQQIHLFFSVGNRYSNFYT